MGERIPLEELDAVMGQFVMRAKDAEVGVKVFVYCVWTQPYRELSRHRLPQGLLQQPYRM